MTTKREKRLRDKKRRKARVEIEATKERQAMTAAPALLTFASGTSYRMAPLSDQDISTLDHWVQQRFLATARASMPETEPTMSPAEARAVEESRERIERVSLQVAVTLTFMSGTGARILASVSGMVQLVWQCIRREHPDVTIDDLRKELLDPKNIDEARRMFGTLNTSGGEEPSRKKRGASQRRRPSRKNRSTVL